LVVDGEPVVEVFAAISGPGESPGAAAPDVELVDGGELDEAVVVVNGLNPPPGVKK
jgi:hypothetical protein